MRLGELRRAQAGVEHRQAEAAVVPRRVSAEQTARGHLLYELRRHYAGALDLLVVRLELAQDELAHRLLPLDEVRRKSKVHDDRARRSCARLLQLWCRMVIYSCRRSTPVAAMRFAESG
jgi:hypothetical protein